MCIHHILLINDHPMFRVGLSMVINQALPHAKIYQASSVDEALGSAPSGLDLVLLDIKLHGCSGLEGIVCIKRQWRAESILMLSSHDEPETTRLALARGRLLLCPKPKRQIASLRPSSSFCTRGCHKPYPLSATTLTKR